ncbi:MAG: prepilin-type N-terminal cleavage/methylation domain-containing protein [Acholeplasmataceae bacterium]
MDKNKGFTLVELIVVIAIIAILASVSIAGFSTYIDRARFSNDTQVAAQMTTILKNHLTLTPEEDLDSYQVRDIIESYDEEISFTPTADHTGYFYLADVDEIIAARFEDAEDIIATELATFEQTVFLSNQELNGGDYASPEELFGAGSHLLTTEETPVAMVVNFVSTMANSGSRIEADYAEAVAAIADYQGSLFIRLFGNALPEELETKVDDFIDAYDPDNTLFVNNTNWATAATQGSAINRVVTTPGLSNIPSFDLSLTDKIDTTITFPSTVRTAEENAIPDSAFEDTTVIEFKGSPEIKLEGGISINDVFGSDLGVDSSVVSTEELSLEMYVGKIERLSEYKYSLSELRDLFNARGEVITGYRLEIDVEYPRDTRVYVYTADGLVGYATPYIKSPGAE